jgi:hypothetical protein
LFYSFVCSSHLCILSYMHIPYGAFFINKEFDVVFKVDIFLYSSYGCNFALGKLLSKYIINSIDSSTIFAKFMKMSISCLLKSIVSIKYFESDFLEKS